MKGAKIPLAVIILCFVFGAVPFGIVFAILRILYESNKDAKKNINNFVNSNTGGQKTSGQHTVYHSSYGTNGRMSQTGYKTGEQNNTDNQQKQNQPFSGVNPNPQNTTYHYSYVNDATKSGEETVKSTFTPPMSASTKKSEGFNPKKIKYKTGSGTVLSTIFMFVSLFFTLIAFISTFENVMDFGIAQSMGAVAATMVMSCLSAVLYMFRQYFKSRDYRIICYLSLMRGERFISVEKLADIADVSESRVIKDLQHMITKGLLGPEAIINKRIRYLVLRTDAIDEAEADYNRKKNGGAEINEKPSVKSKEEIAEDISEHEKILRRIRELNDDIENKEVSDKIDKIEELTRKIFKYIEEKPQLEPQIQSFLNYYLPTTLKLLNSYAYFEEQGVRGENIDTGMKNIEETLDMLIDGYVKQLDKLFESDTLDVTTDINVLEQMMKADGFSSDNDFSTVNSDGTINNAADKDGQSVPNVAADNNMSYTQNSAFNFNSGTATAVMPDDKNDKKQ